ncbi:MAG: biosynthetic arginine decarboxylase [Bacteroides sp.]|nr:biosynthetic arginine decarboxylase [Bacteroides sp.]MCM1379701.1 biosynthetic arginine decarboxylase [Bacteroides sp.]MCM1446056.1 biosynthetic arginine decarboxylase [Prevotella sp.]
MRKWRIEDSAELYNINGWGLNYFSINDKGHVQVTPKDGLAAVDLKDVMDELQVRDIQAPVLLRFPDILDNRVEKISNCFKQAAQTYSYQAQNYVIYPIKVNQIREVVEEIVSHGKKFNIGLEAGSKPELHAVLATNIAENALIICNGYKDENYIELALLAQKMGRRIFLVVEKLNELRIIARVAKRLDIMPNVGIRIKISNSGSGKWQESGGDQSKFGLNSSELLEAVDFLEKNGLKDSLKLIHFHIGSQITKIRRIKNALREAMQFYVQLSKMGFNIDFVDIGGGLGVDYDGTRSSSSESSMNYSIQEYANDAVSALVDVCVKNDLRQPNIITESGRSLSAHHSILIFEALESTSLPAWKDNEELPAEAHELARELYDIWDKLDISNLYEAWHDALQIREEALELFSIGILDLRTRAQVEKLFWSVAREVAELGNSMKHPPEELRKITRMIPDKYFCNFSLFQSLPDHWAIDQIFPIMPISRLDEKPTRYATIQDMTCDSDGKIAHFITASGLSDSLPVHPIKASEPYYIGVFLVGAYQEILGDLHNLFGDTSAVHIDVYPDHYEIDKIIDGETVAEVLDYVQFSPKALVRNVERWVTAAMKSGKITPEEGRAFLSNYRSGLYGYTYLEKD